MADIVCIKLESGSRVTVRVTPLDINVFCSVFIYLMGLNLIN